MLIILTISLVIASIWILCVKRTRESMFLVGLCISLMLEICGVMIFIAKKGGISTEVLTFFYFTKDIKNRLQYLMMTLNQLGYMIAIGRTLFPFFLLELSMCYSMTKVVRKNIWLEKAVAILPLITLVFYFPNIYRSITLRNVAASSLLGQATMIWMHVYLVLAVFLLLYEFKSITMKICRGQFSYIMVCMIALTGLYYMYFRQDPGQIYHFYNYSFVWNAEVGYLLANPPLFRYIMMVGVSVVCCILGFLSLFRFTRGHYEENKDDVVMERKFDTAKVGASMFVHSMKNQLLSSKVIYKRIHNLYEQTDIDVEKVKEYVDTLEEFNNVMFERMEELYRCVKSNAIYMVPMEIEEIFENAVSRFQKKYPNVKVDIEIEQNVKILADKIHLCEALYNLLVNAQEAVMEADRDEQANVVLICHDERLYTVIEVRDNGLGMCKTQVKKIFDPFYSSKNSNSNWGMGLYYVREIVKSHLGSLRVESEEGVGSSFYILLPKYSE